MTHSLRLSFPSSAFESSTSSLRRRAPGFRFPCFSTQTNSEDDSIPCRKQSILVERYSNGAIKRYILDDGSGVRSSFEEDLVTDYELQGSFQGEGKERPWPLPRVVADFVLPAGYPGSVSDDYLQYMLLQFPTNVTGWICHALVTSSLLKAVGVGYSTGTAAAATAAAIRWVSKDGIGALGRLFIGGRFGNLFDDDPKQWRMYADFIGSAGSCTQATSCH